MEEEELALFRSRPRSFKLDRRSSEASELKDAVSRKLPDFLADYDDDVLAEYIVVLVCNGKHQNQARHDLEDFLGEQSGKFVEWLWKHLSEDMCKSNKPLTFSNHKTDVQCNDEDDLNRKGETGIRADLHTEAPEASDFPLSQSQLYMSSTLDNLDDFQRWCPSIDVPLTQMNTERSHATPFRTDSDSVPAENCGDALKCSVVSPQILAGGEQCLRYENQDQKINESNSNVPPFQSMHLLTKEPVTRNLRSVIAENPQFRPTPKENITGRRLPSKAVDALPPNTAAQPRGNVWDRLGKPVKGDDDLVHEMQIHDALLAKKRKELGQNVGELQKSRLMWAIPGTKLSRISREESRSVVSNCLPSEHRVPSEGTPNVGIKRIADSAQRKRLFQETESGNSSMSFSHCMGNKLQKDEASQNLGKELSNAGIGSRSSNVFGSKVMASNTLSLEKFPRTSPTPKVYEKPRPRLNMDSLMINSVQKVVEDNVQTLSKSESLRTVGGNANLKLGKNEMLDVKLRLHQIEKDMLKLRSKQAKMAVDTKVDGTPGAQNPEEDIKTRAVLVTNVHFAAPKEALLSHFSKCGVVAKVIMLMDTVTAQPKGAAYIVFSSKESVEKAISLSGTSFFSRILTVMPKADMPPGFLVPPQSAGKIVQSWHTPPHNKGSDLKNYSSPHLQWRRDQLANGGNSVSASRTHGFEVSSTGE